MSMEIPGIGSYYDYANTAGPGTPQQRHVPPASATDEAAHQHPSFAHLQAIAELHGRRLEYSMNRDIGRVVVKIVDTRTDKVIREIPPKAIQELDRRMQEAVGLLFDRKI